MAALIFLVLNLAASLFKPRWRLEAENAALRQQLIVLQRKVRGRVEFTNGDRLFFIQLYRWFPSILKAITTFRTKTKSPQTKASASASTKPCSTNFAVSRFARRCIVRSTSCRPISICGFANITR
jgi:hypothetical protein